MLSVSLMCFGSLMIAATPTYTSIGICAPISLAIARIIQGLSLVESTEQVQPTLRKWPISGIAASIPAFNT